MSTNPLTRGKKQKIDLLLQQGRYEEARPLLVQVCETDRRDTGAWYVMATVNHHLGRIEDAATAYERVIALQPSRAEAHYGLGIVRQEQGNQVEAIRLYRQTLALKPDHLEACSNLGTVLEDMGHFEDARCCYEQALRLDPTRAASYYNLGSAQRGLQQYQEAEQSYRRAIELQPNLVDAYTNLGIVLRRLGKPEEAMASYRRALEINPDSVAALDNLGSALMEQGDLPEALASYQHALALAPTDGLRIKIALAIPAIPQSVDEILETRQQLEKNLIELAGVRLSLRDPLKEVGRSNFFLSYHGLDNRNLQTRVARLYESACPSLLWTAPHCLSPRKNRGRIRIGFISKFMYHHSIGRITQGVFANLSRERFETFALFVPPLIEDDVSSFIRKHADRVVTVQTPLEAARKQIAELELDILFYQDIGMEPFTYFLAFARLAPVQCVFFGHPDTTGIRNMDYFISNDLFEPENAQEHFSEKLFLLHDLGAPTYYYKPRLPETLKSREAFGLSTAAHIYLCPQTLFKLHPDFDHILAGILRGDPNGQIVLIEGHVPGWTDMLIKRFRRVMPDVTDRIVFIPQQKGGDFLNLFAVADVVLDTIYFNGMNTSLEGFSVGTPIVTMPSVLQRGRHTAGMYRKMGIGDCVARSPREYVDIAVRLGTQPDFRQAVRDRILAANAVLYEDKRVIQEFERFFTEAVTGVSS